jgi:hypothetical protein
MLHHYSNEMQIREDLLGPINPLGNKTILPRSLQEGTIAKPVSGLNLQFHDILVKKEMLLLDNINHKLGILTFWLKDH